MREMGDRFWVWKVFRCSAWRGLDGMGMGRYVRGCGGLGGRGILGAMLGLRRGLWEILGGVSWSGSTVDER